MKKDNGHIVFLAPMDAELNALLQRFPTAQTTTETVKDVVFHHMDYHGVRISAACSGVGKVNTACTATLAINAFAPDVLINVGVAGAMDARLKLLDWVVAESFVYTDVDVTALGFPPGQLLGEPLRYPVDTNLLSKVRALADKGAFHTPLHFGLVGSSDAFIHRSEQVDYIRKSFDNEVICVEMEGAALAHVCRRLNVPLFALRAISDVACDDGENAMDYEKFLVQAAAKAADIALILVDALAKDGE